MSKIKRVKYFTKERKKLINPDNIELYEKYLKSNIIKNRDVKDTTFKTYENYFYQFLVYVAENCENVGLYDEEFMDNAVDIMEGFIAFCQDTLFNHKKVINTKISAVSSFYLWSLKRGLIDKHPFDKKLDRMKGANEEKIINSYFLNDEQIRAIRKELMISKKYDIQDRIIFEVFLESANRVGAISKLTLSSLDLDNMLFEDIREKRGYKVEVVFDEVAKDLIEEWLEIRKEMDNLEVDALFITKHKGTYRQMAYGTIQNRIQKIGKIVGIEDFHAHCMRKTKLNEVYETTGDLSAASEYANHKGTDVTLLYIQKKSKTELRDKIKKMKEEKIRSQEQEDK